MGVLSSLFRPHKCVRVYNKEQKFCVYFADILLSGIIILLLIPQILVVRFLLILNLFIGGNYNAVLSFIEVVPLEVQECNETVGIVLHWGGGPLLELVSSL